MKNLLLAGLVITNTALAQPAASPSAIVGEWRGASVCTNLALAPACKDETIRYVFTAVKDSTNKVHLVADKLVNGRFEPMGEFDVDYSAAANAWQYDFVTRDQMKLRWEYKIEDSMLSGAIFVRESGERLRKVTASRVKAP